VSLFVLPMYGPPLFPTTIEDAILVQQDLRQRVRLDNDFGNVKTIAGIDASYDIQNDLTRAYIVVLSLDTLTIIDRAFAIQPTRFPYVPGFLSFRETPTILDAYEKLQVKPDLIMVDGQGIAHPRRFGIACHVGVLLDKPAIGVAKSRLYGWGKEPGPHKFDQTPLQVKGEQIGTILRSKEKTKPLYISPGHRIDPATAVNLTQRCCTRYRLPEPTRLADKWSKEKIEPAMPMLL
jgi:deoxyribonuclease V